MLFHFNIHSSLLLPCFIQGILYSILLIYRYRTQDNKADLFLAFLTLWATSHISGWMLGFAGWYDSHDAYTQFMFYYKFSNWFLLGPLLFFFTKSKTNSYFEFKRKDWWHFAAPFAIYGWTLVCFFIDIVYKQNILGETLPYHYNTKGDFGQMPLGFLNIPINALSYVSLIYYFIKSIQHYRKYKNYIVAELSIAEEVEFQWVRNILYAFLAAVVVWLGFDLTNMLTEGVSFQTEWWGYFFWGLTIFYITISGYRDVSHINHQIAFDPTTKRAEPDVEEMTSSSKKVIPIQEMMQSEQLYLKPNLSLHDLSRTLRISSGELSKHLNSEFNQNFNEFVNEYRIQEVIKKLKDKEFEHYSILGIALECGFNSKATFNRVFKSHTGMSPSQYRKAEIQSG